MAVFKFSLLLFFPHSSPCHSNFQFQISLSIMHCSTVSFLAISTRSSAYFTVWIIFPPMLKPPSPSRASLVRHSPYKLNRIGDKQHPCLTPLPICTLPVYHRSSRTLTLWSMYNFLINLLSRQSIPVLFRICIRHLAGTNTFISYPDYLTTLTEPQELHYIPTWK